MSEELETSQELEVDAPEVEVEELENDAEVESSEDSSEQEEQPEAPVDDSEELDFNGQTHKLPKTIAEAVRSMQKDYTVKTQAVAEQRKAFEAEYKFRQDNINEIAEVTAFDKQIQQYKNVDWNALNQSDPVMFQQLRLQYDEIKEARQTLAGNLAQKHQTETLQKQQEFAKQMQESDAVLRRDIKDWSSDKENELVDYAVREFKLDRQDILNGKTNPNLFKLINKAFIGDQLLKKQTTKPVAVAKRVEPVPVVAGRGATGKTGVPTDFKEYQKWRRQGY